MIKALRALFALLVLLAGAAAFYLLIPFDLPQQPAEFSLEQGSLKAAAKQMQQAGVLTHPELFVLLTRIMGKASNIKAGNYELTSPVTPLELLAKITKGDYSQSEVTFVEGWTFRELRQALDQNPSIRHDSAALSDKEIMARIGATESSPEGLFFPDTYFFAKGQSDLSLLKRSYLLMKPRFSQAWESRNPDLPFTEPYQALILASIVEKETGREADRPMIAAVFVNRLRIGMRLQTDPAVIYGLGPKFDGNLRRSDLQNDQPYNTYTRAGLPPTPIAMPGMKSIEAALHPAKSRALYFVARGDGSSYFSNSLEEHNRAVNQYQKK